MVKFGVKMENGIEKQEMKVESLIQPLFGIIVKNLVG
jgi:hypothetical protein